MTKYQEKAYSNIGYRQTRKSRTAPIYLIFIIEVIARGILKACPTFDEMRYWDLDASSLTPAGMNYTRSAHYSAYRRILNIRNDNGTSLDNVKRAASVG